jgi:flagellar motor component MotA
MMVGQIDALRHVSNVSSVGNGIGTAFVSTIYGLTLAKLVLLPSQTGFERKWLTLLKCRSCLWKVCSHGSMKFILGPFAGG